MAFFIVGPFVCRLFLQPAIYLAKANGTQNLRDVCTYFNMHLGKIWQPMKLPEMGKIRSEKERKKMWRVGREVSGKSK